MESDLGTAIVVLSIPMGIGFVLGYGVRELISRHRHAAIENAWLREQRR